MVIAAAIYNHCRKNTAFENVTETAGRARPVGTRQVRNGLYQVIVIADSSAQSQVHSSPMDRVHKNLRLVV